MRDDAHGAVMDHEQGRGVSVAETLMRMALALLDRSCHAVAAARLQSAIDAVSMDQTHEPGLQDEHEARPEIMP